MWTKICFKRFTRETDWTERKIVLERVSSHWKIKGNEIDDIEVAKAAKLY